MNTSLYIFFSFSFVYNKRTFEFKCETKNETDYWVECLKFLNNLQQGSAVISTRSAQAKQYFQSLPTFTAVVEDLRVKKDTNGNQMTTQDDEKTESNLIPTENNKKKKKEKKSKPLEVFKFNNIDSGAYAALYRENP